MQPVYSYSRWNSQLPDLRKHYQTAEPFPHIALDNFLETPVLERALQEFPKADSQDWISYRHINSNKLGKTDRKTFPPTVGAVIDELNSPQFVQFISELSGIEGLFPDEDLEGGGMHQSTKGGFLNVHADFTAHTHHPDWQRRVNIIVYLNKDWDDAYGGQLELWDKQMTKVMHRVSPIFNRVVIFNCDFDSFHGHPIPMTCPENMSRKSLALYYYTKQDRPVLAKSTEYRARPSDSTLRKVFIYLDKMALRAYDKARRTFGISDKTVSKFLRFFSKK